MIDSKMVVDLRAQTGAGMVDCKKALEEANGDIEKAIGILREKGAAKAAKKDAERETAEGLVTAYVHTNGKVGALVELQCETDFVARNPEFKQLAYEIAMQVAAMAPQYVSSDEIPAGIVEKEKSGFLAEIEGKPDDIKAKIVEGKLAKWYADVCLLNQIWVKDDTKTIAQLISEKVATIGEKITIARVARLELAPKQVQE
jgi:elongation factor Ts